MVKKPGIGPSLHESFIHRRVVKPGPQLGQALRNRRPPATGQSTTSPRSGALRQDSDLDFLAEHCEQAQELIHGLPPLRGVEEPVELSR